MIPQIKYAPVAHKTTIDDNGEIISLYIYPFDVDSPPRFVAETSDDVDCLVATVDINEKGNVHGIEVILKRRHT